jgi:hypothetical protein
MNNPALPAFAVVALASLGLLLWLFLSAAFLLWGARLAGVEKRSFGRAIGTLFVGGIASLLLTMALSAAPLVGTGAGLLLGFGVSSVVMMAIFDTTFGKALVANILAWALPFLVAGGIALIGFALMGVVFALS